MNPTLQVYTDGSSLGNPGPGGWGLVLLSDQRVRELGGRAPETTNNRMELQAVIEAFEHLAHFGLRDYAVSVHADSTYALDGLTKWLEGWKARGWLKADKQPVLNQDLWMRLDEMKAFLETDNKLFFHHVRGHTGEEYNERVDEIARKMAGRQEVELYDGTRSGYVLT